MTKSNKKKWVKLVATPEPLKIQKEAKRTQPESITSKPVKPLFKTCKRCHTRFNANVSECCDECGCTDVA